MAQPTAAQALSGASADVGYRGPSVRDLRDEWASSLTAHGRRPETIRTYLAGIDQFADFLDDQGMPAEVASVRREHVEAFIIHLLETKSQSTAKTRFGALKTFWRYVVEDAGEADRSPMERMKAPAVDELDTPVPDVDAIRRLLAACKGTGFEERRDTALIMLAVDTGLRRGELAALRVSDLDMKLRTVEVGAAGSKSRRRRVVSFSVSTGPKLAQYLRARARHPKAAAIDHLPDGHPDRGALWLGKVGAFGGEGFAQMLERRCDAAGIDRIHPHQLRHFFADQLKSTGASDETLMALGGWRSHQMVQRYGRAEQQRRANELYRQVGGTMDRL